MEKEKFTIIALIGGILIVSGSFLPWTSVGGETASGWDSFEVLMLSSGILVLLGTLTKLGLESESLSYLIPIGGVLALIDGIQIYRANLELTSVSESAFSWEYGLFISIIGAILTLISTGATLKEN